MSIQVQPSSTLPPQQLNDQRLPNPQRTSLRLTFGRGAGGGPAIFARARGYLKAKGARYKRKGAKGAASIRLYMTNALSPVDTHPSTWGNIVQSKESKISQIPSVPSSNRSTF